MPLEALEVVKRGSMTDEALCEEASRYVKTLSFSGEGERGGGVVLRALFFYSFFWIQLGCVEGGVLHWFGLYE